ncbi:c-Myc-binding protein-like isoform X2 [Cyprinus carpio]|uniref:c-Myc-binding protein-like isoform X2 n=1 Tax=Cyprinus carpio TaxID=7962 RepID=A0A9Q9XH52_CYPCA|nr:c-Myc-binding protein-like isoform X2 [Cyprinus carpio]
MAHYRVSESKREQFRRYLEKAGVLESLTNGKNIRSIHRMKEHLFFCVADFIFCFSVLVALYEETEKPNNALDFIKHQLGVGPEAEDAESLRLELNTLQQKYDQLMEENKELRSRLLQYEPAQGGGTE